MAVRFDADCEPVPGYRLIGRIGSGGFGEVWKCEAPGGIFKAVKIIHGDLRSKDNDLVRYAEQELKSLKRVKSVRHPFLLALDRYDIIEGRLLIVMELADCNLWERFREYRLKGQLGIPREELLTYMSETAEVLDLMNVEHGLMHLDIKPQNIFLQYNHVKVGDFGQVKDLEGMFAEVTGGITPVYAAPETFDGVASRYCDQYSLACVYQELLTGQRPFDGSSMQQLLMQHLTAPPNLAPSPPGDRIALRKALAKKSEERFPNCFEFVKALRNPPDSASIVVAESEVVTASSADRLSELLLGGSSLHPARTSDSNAYATTPGSKAMSGSDFMRTDTPMPRAIPVAESARIAPPEQTGDGPIRPTLIIGLGQTGLEVLQRVRKETAQRYGSAQHTPCLRTLFIDTDPDTLEAATTERQGVLSALRPEEVFAAKLNRPAYYMKARANGRSLVEGWFDSQLLHRLPRTPVTMGLRTLGRLAFCDHQRALLHRITEELELATSDDALAETLANTSLELHTNRPHVYLVAGLAGGTGGGMFLDLAYAVRARLKLLGYTPPEITGVFLVPPDDNTDALDPQCRANTYASLTELNHYSRMGATFQAVYDDGASVYETEPPFTDIVMLPAPPPSVSTNTPAGSHTPSTPLNTRRGTPTGATYQTRLARDSGSKLKPGSRTMPNQNRPEMAVNLDAFDTAAGWLRLKMLSPFGRVSDASRPVATVVTAGVAVRAIGLSRYDWPRWEIVDRTARVLGVVVVDHWISHDFSRSREQIPVWVLETMASARLTGDALMADLNAAIIEASAEPMETALNRATELLQPKGWLARTPDANRILHAVDEVTRLIGTPGTNRTLVHIEDTIRNRASEIVANVLPILHDAVHALVDDPKFRLAGAEEAIQQINAYFVDQKTRSEQSIHESERTARVGYDLLMAYVHPQRGSKKASAAELGDALHTYPIAHYRAILSRRIHRVFDHLRTVFGELGAEIAACRQRIQSLQVAFVADMDQPTPPIGPRQVTPVGCATVDEASQQFLKILNDDDLHEAELWIQNGIERDFGGLYQACLNSGDGPTEIMRVLREQCRLFLNARLGETDLTAMFAAKFGTHASVVRAFADAYRDAAPGVVGNGPWAKPSLTVLGTPAGEAGESFRQCADEAFPINDRTAFADTADEIAIYREYPYVPLNTLPQFGHTWAAAYRTAWETTQCTPHIRTDITEWAAVDAD